MQVRPLRPDDFHNARASAEEWFGGTVHEPIHPVFFHHFGGYVAEDEGRMIGFLIGFRSHSNRDIAYIHAVAIGSERRGEGIATNLYRRFEQQARTWGCAEIEAVADPTNEAALKFHQALGFWWEVVADWAGPGADRAVLHKRLDNPL